MASVLVVDDEPDILLLHRLNLEAAGHRVVLAADGITALERIAEERPDVVVLDVMMPVLDGWGVLERLRIDPLRRRCSSCRRSRRQADMQRPATSAPATTWPSRTTPTSCCAEWLPSSGPEQDRRDD